jgi:hypothetical protein
MFHSHRTICALVSIPLPFNVNTFRQCLLMSITDRNSKIRIPLRVALLVFCLFKNLGSAAAVPFRLLFPISNSFVVISCHGHFSCSDTRSFQADNFFVKAATISNISCVLLAVPFDMFFLVCKIVELSILFTFK